MMEKEAQTTITINSYQKVWGYEKMVYQITNNVTLLQPVTQSDLVYFVFSLAVVAILCSIFKLHVSSLTMAMMVYGGIPLFATKILRYKSFDGKNPFMFMGDYLQFYFERGQEREFLSIAPKEPIHQAVWRLGSRHRLRMPQREVK